MRKQHLDSMPILFNSLLTQSRVTQLEREKNYKVRYFDQQIKSEQDQIKQFTRQIDDLKRHI